MPAILQTLKNQFVQQFSAKGSVSLLVGLACNLAFIGQVYFWPVLWHTSVFVVSYTDASYVGQLACSLVLIAYFKKTNRLSLNARVLWVSAILVQCTLILYYILFEMGVEAPDPLHWVCGALFGVYLPIALVSWVRLFLGSKPTRVMWNIMFSAIFASFAIWLFSGLAALKICVCMGILAITATAILSYKLKEIQLDRPDEPASQPKFEYSYSSVATFLFSLAFVIAVSFAGLGGATASFATGAFFAPMLIVCVLLLFVDPVGLPLTSVAVPAIVTATIAASTLHFEPALSFDIAALGMFLFLAFAVVLLCSSGAGNRRKRICEFLLLMAAFGSGCVVGRVVVVICTLCAGDYSSDILILVSVIASFAAMIILIRKGFTRQRAQQLFALEDEETAAYNKAVSSQAKLDEVVATHNIGEREKEVLMLLLEGDSASMIARKLVIANGTAKSHIRHVYKKLGVHNRGELFEIFSLDEPASHAE
ncbi:helix-turn-helix transcriptional regulator [Eggerthellaceae bacterium 3-80]